MLCSLRSSDLEQLGPDWPAEVHPNLLRTHLAEKYHDALTTSWLCRDNSVSLRVYCISLDVCIRAFNAINTSSVV